MSGKREEGKSSGENRQNTSIGSGILFYFICLFLVLFIYFFLLESGLLEWQEIFNLCTNISKKTREQCCQNYSGK